MFNQQNPKPKAGGRDASVKPKSAPVIPETTSPKEGEVDPRYQYKDFQKAQFGPLGKFPTTWSFYDLLFEQSINAEKIRQCFEDWVIPQCICAAGENGNMITSITNVQTFTRGEVTTAQFNVEQFVYAVLNPDLNLTSDSGNYAGSKVSRTSIFACVRIGDIRRPAFLENAHVAYALRVNAPWSQWARIATREVDPETHERYYFYNVEGDQDLMKALEEKWFDRTGPAPKIITGSQKKIKPKYLFNGTIYPILSGAQANQFT